MMSMLLSRRLLVPGLLLAVSSGAVAQSGTGGTGSGAAAGSRTPRAARFDTVMLRRHDLARHDAILARFDSIRAELETLGRDAPEYARLARELTLTIARLAAEQDLPRARVELRRAEEGDVARAMSQAIVAARGGLMTLRDRTPFPKGFIGLNVEAPYHLDVRGDSAFIRYFAYPEIVSVEPDSPAERAGIMSGDQLAAYDGRDVREREVNLTRLLRPRNRITVTVRRDGTQRDYQLMVADAPRSFVTRRVLTLRDSGVLAGEVRIVPNEALAPPAPQLRSFVFSLDPARAPVAGANMVAIEDEALGRPFGVEFGLLVTSVADGPARRAGLVGGDVIVGVDGREIRSIAQLRRFMEARGDAREVTLQVIRQRQPRAITVRW